MARDEALTRKSLDRLLTHPNTPRIPLEGAGLAVISDLHMGNGGSADNFGGNEAALLRALAAYREAGSRLVLLGDIEELWQFAPEEIEGCYGPVYARIRDFGPHRVLRVWGNHDPLWAEPGSPDPARACPAQEGLVVESDGRGMLLVHGHQGSLESDIMGGLSRLFVRLFRCFEGPWILLMKLLGLYRRPSTMTRVRSDFERVMHGWARDRDTVLVCGHSHRAVFGSRSWAERLRSHSRHLRELMAMVPPSTPEHAELGMELRRTARELARERRQGRDFEPVEGGEGAVPRYFNSGCGLYREGITALELGPDEVRLVKWGNSWGDREVYHRMPMARIL